MPELYVLVHIPKTGGQSLRDHFNRHLRPHEEYIHLGPAGIESARELGLEPFAERSAAQRAKARVIQGHEVDRDTHRLVPESTPRHVVFLREPAERLVSHYNFSMAVGFPKRGLAPISFDAWWEDAQRATMVNWICERFLGYGRHELPAPERLARAIATLEEFWLVGLLEHFARDTARLLAAIGVPPLDHRARSNVTGRHFERRLEATPELRRKMAPALADDYRLYAHFDRNGQESAR